MLTQRPSILVHIENKHCTKYEEKSNHKYLCDTAYNQAFLRFFHILAGKGALHQVLIKSCSCNHHENTSNELFPEVGILFRIVEEENA